MLLYFLQESYSDRRHCERGEEQGSEEWSWTVLIVVLPPTTLRPESERQSTVHKATTRFKIPKTSEVFFKVVRQWLSL